MSAGGGLRSESPLPLPGALCVTGQRSSEDEGGKSSFKPTDTATCPGVRCCAPVAVVAPPPSLLPEPEASCHPFGHHGDQPGVVAYHLYSLYHTLTAGRCAVASSCSSTSLPAHANERPCRPQTADVSISETTRHRGPSYKSRLRVTMPCPGCSTCAQCHPPSTRGTTQALPPAAPPQPRSSRPCVREGLSPPPPPAHRRHPAPNFPSSHPQAPTSRLRVPALPKGTPRTCRRPESPACCDAHLQRGPCRGRVLQELVQHVRGVGPHTLADRAGRAQHGHGSCGCHACPVRLRGPAGAAATAPVGVPRPATGVYIGTSVASHRAAVCMETGVGWACPAGAGLGEGRGACGLASGRTCLG